MKKRLTGVALAVAALGALVFAVAAYAAYTTPKLSVTYPAGATRILASANVNDDATARVAIIIPNGTSINTSAAPGTKVGTVQAQVSALALGGALLPLAGDIVVAPSGAVPAASQTACIVNVTPQATYLLVLTAAGQTINVPAYIIGTAAPQQPLGQAQLVFCLAPPDIPADKGGATFGAKFLSADLTFSGVFSPLTEALWVAYWTPWQAGTGQVNPAAAVASVDVVGPGAVTLKGKRITGRVVLTGKVTQLGVSIGERVQIWGAVGKAALRPIKSVVAKDNGTYTLTLSRKAKQTVFQARVNSPEASVSGADADAICKEAFANAPLGVPCSGYTISGFTARSKNVAVR